MAGVTSCEDILRVDSKTLLLEDEVNFNSATDSVYAVLGIIKKLQAVADRTVILGEVRGDLVALGNKDHVSEDIKDLYDFYTNGSLKSGNKYDNPLDYYAIITNCNLFLHNVDTTVVHSEKKVLKSEYINVLNYRAWTYLQLAQIYGTVLYYDDPITVDKVKDGTPLNIKQLANTLLLDYKDEFIKYYDKNPSNYGEFTVQGTKHKTKYFFIPTRLIMGDLNLWAENYPKAAYYYHDFIVNEKGYTTGTNSVHWECYDFLYLGNDTYYNLFSSQDDVQTCYIPMEGEETDGGIVSDLENIFESTEKNNNWYQLTRSAAATAISVRQNYCYHKRTSPSVRKEWAAYIEDKGAEKVVLRRGDLRLQSILETDYEDATYEEGNKTDRGTETQMLRKINSEKICLYRKDVVFLRLAEALNRCGLPQTAFTILKSGLCEATIDSISQVEKDRAKSMGIYDVYDYPKKTYVKATADWDYVTRSKSQGGGQVFSFRWLPGGGTTIGIHSRGCGDASYDPNYVIPIDTVRLKTLTPEEALTDSIRAVEELLIDEMALETCFEGYRFGDLLRIAQHRGKDVGGDFENDFLARRIATRETAALDEADGYYDFMDMSLYNKLLGTDPIHQNDAWFLNLPDAMSGAE